MQVSWDSELVKMFWLGKIKKTACLIVENEDMYKKLKAQIQGLQWPEIIGGKLEVSQVFSPERILEIMRLEQQSIDLNQALTQQQRSYLEQFLIQKQQIKKIVIPPPSENGNETNSNHRNVSVIKKDQEETKRLEIVKQQQIPIKKPLNLDDLFSKTETKPYLYFVPNTQEQIEAKKSELLQQKIKSHTYLDSDYGLKLQTFVNAQEDIEKIKQLQDKISEEKESSLKQMIESKRQHLINNKNADKIMSDKDQKESEISLKREDINDILVKMMKNNKVGESTVKLLIKQEDEEMTDDNQVKMYKVEEAEKLINKTLEKAIADLQKVRV